ncbi:MAG: hypothetical protein A2033_02750 [Bacteroidetes bacterium GWA2_31_9]|nr:MAG: hypothetical protein A2033_02750 [Bacteroidetes bacterium GWA2_31_9]
MNTITNARQISNIYKSLANLNINELEQVMHQIIGLRKDKISNILSDYETELLKKINEGIPDIIHKRYKNLINKKRKNILNDKDYYELLDLTSYFESKNVYRLSFIIELAKLKNLTLDEVIQHLDLKTEMYVE